MAIATGAPKGLFIIKVTLSSGLILIIRAFTVYALSTLISVAGTCFTYTLLFNDNGAINSFKLIFPGNFSPAFLRTAFPFFTNKYVPGFIVNEPLAAVV